MIINIIKRFLNKKQVEEKTKQKIVFIDWLNFYEKWTKAEHNEIPAVTLAERQVKNIVKNNELNYYYKQALSRL